MQDTKSCVSLCTGGECLVSSFQVPACLRPSTSCISHSINRSTTDLPLWVEICAVIWQKE